MEIPALKITIEPISSGMTVEGNTIVTGGPFTVDQFNNRIVVVLPNSSADAAAGRQRYQYFLKILSLMKQKASFGSLVSAIDALNP